MSAKLDQGVRARQELQDLKTKLVDDLEQSRKALQAKVEKVDAKLGATSFAGFRILLRSLTNAYLSLPLHLRTPRHPQSCPQCT